MTNVPSPTSLGSIKEGVIEQTTSNLVNVRAEPNTKAAVRARVRANDPVRWRETPTHLLDGYRWVYLESHAGWIAADLVTFQERVLDAPIKLIDVPFRSQIGPGAGAFNKDCGAACANMLFQYMLIRAGFRPALAVTVDDMARDSELAIKGDKGLTPQAVAGLLQRYGIAAEAVRPLTVDLILHYLDEVGPVIVLVKYAHIRRDPFTGGHFMVVYGYGTHGFWMHDPYTGGANLYVPREALERALADTSEFAAFPNQGVVLRA